MWYQIIVKESPGNTLGKKANTAIIKEIDILKYNAAYLIVIFIIL